MSVHPLHAGILLKQLKIATFLHLCVATRYGNIATGRRMQGVYEKIVIFDHYLALSPRVQGQAII